MIFLPEMYKDAKAFVKKHQLPITAVAAAATTYYLVHDVKVTVLTQQIDRQNIRDLVEATEHAYLIEFIEHKGLRDEYFAFSKERII